MSLNVLNELQEIVECVLEHLPVKEVNKFMILNKVWRDAGRHVKSKRNNSFSWFTIQSLRHNTPAIDKGFIENLYSEPSFALAFTTLQLDRSGFKIKNNNKYRSINYNTFLSNNLPPHCTTLNIVTDQIITYHSEEGRAEEEKDPTSCILFPRMKELDFQVVLSKSKDKKRQKISFPQAETDNNSKTHPILQAASTSQTATTLHQATHSNTHKENHMVPKLVLLFGRKSALKLRQHFQCPVAGSFVEQSYIGMVNYPKVGLVLMGGEEVRVAMVVLQNNVEKRIKELYDAVVAMASGTVRASDAVRVGNNESSLGSGDNSIKGGVFDAEHKKSATEKFKAFKSLFALMFSCVARGTEEYGSRNVESSVFSEAFPGVPLFGTFGSGEIGQDVLWREGCEGSNYESDGHLVHFYSTVFVVVGITKK